MLELVKQQEAMGNVEPASVNDLDGLYHKLLAELAVKGPAWPPLLSAARLVGIENDTAVLRYPHDHDQMVKVLERNGKKDALRELLTTIVGRSIAIRIEFDEPPTDEPAPVASKPRKSTPAPQQPAAPIVQTITQEMRQELRKDPLVETFIKQFGAEIVRVE